MRACLPAVLAAGLALGGCGEREIAPPLPAVQLTLDGPSDAATVEDDAIDVRGRVEPVTASVRVNGDQVDVRGGAFATTVSLEDGVNVIDVQAGAPRHPAAMRAVRVTRLVPVEIPELARRDPDDAGDALSALGLQPQFEDAGSLLDDLLGGDPAVCGTDPPAGDEVSPGSDVLVVYARAC